MKQKTVRIWMAIVGNILVGTAVGFYKNANFGIDCYQCLNTGLDYILPFNFGTVSLLLNLVLFVFMYRWGRHYIGFNTFCNMFLLGYIIQYSDLAIRYFVPDPTMAIRIGFLVFGSALLCFSAGMYFAADLGVSTYDAIALIVDERGLWKFRYCRICTDLTCAGIGMLLGVTIGVGTIITGCLMGPMIDFFRKKVFQPFLEKFPVAA